MKSKAVLLVFLISIAIYSNSLSGEFVWDDEYFVVQNTYIRDLKNIPLFFTDNKAVASGGLSKDVYRPLTILSYALDYRFWRFNTLGYHLTNILLHALNGALLFLFLYTLFNRIPAALLGSLLFVSHPVQTEVVSWISGRSSVLFLFFYLLSLILYVNYSKKRRRPYLILSLAAFAVSLFSKEMAVTLPLLLIAYDIHFAKKEGLKNRIQGYIPYFALAAFYVSVRSVVLKQVSQTGWWGGSPYYTFITMLKAVIDYLKTLAFPVNLCAVFYPIPVSTSMADWKVIFAIILFIMIIFVSVFVYKRDKSISFFMWWFFMTLIPVSNIVPLKALAAERFLYLPSIGFCLVLALGIERLSSVIKRRDDKSPRFFVTAILITIVTVYSIRTIVRNEDWKDGISISEKTIDANPLNPWALTSLGSYLVERAKYEEAVRPLKKAISLAKDFNRAHSNLGSCYLKMNRYQDAVEELKTAVRLDPDDLSSRNSLAVSYANLGRFDEAIMEFEAVLKKDPSYFNSYLNLAQAYEMRMEYDKALEVYMKIPEHVTEKISIGVAYIRIGDLYARTSRKEDAKAFYLKVRGLRGPGTDVVRALAADRLKGL